MPSSESVGRLNVASAALLSQLLFVVILYSGAALIRANNPGYRLEKGQINPASFAWWILVLAVLSLGVPWVSDELVSLWRPAFGDPAFLGLPFALAVPATFTMNIACIAVLVSQTRGSRQSEFSPAFFVLPALAIFLREPLPRLLYYMAAIVTAFTLTLRSPSPGYVSHYPEQSPLAFWMVSVASMSLAVLIGWATRPQ